jgi:hypothetical protein
LGKENYINKAMDTGKDKPLGVWQIVQNSASQIVQKEVNKEVKGKL